METLPSRRRASTNEQQISAADAAMAQIYGDLNATEENLRAITDLLQSSAASPDFPASQRRALPETTSSRPNRSPALRAPAAPAARAEPLPLPEGFLERFSPHSADTLTPSPTLFDYLRDLKDAVPRRVRQSLLGLTVATVLYEGYNLTNHNTSFFGIAFPGIARSGEAIRGREAAPRGMEGISIDKWGRPEIVFKADNISEEIHWLVPVVVSEEKKDLYISFTDGIYSPRGLGGEVVNGHAGVHGGMDFALKPTPGTGGDEKSILDEKTIAPQSGTLLISKEPSFGNRYKVRKIIDGHTVDIYIGHIDRFTDDIEAKIKDVNFDKLNSQQVYWYDAGQVEAGDEIAFAGQSGSQVTGPHAHVGVYIDGVAQDFFQPKFVSAMMTDEQRAHRVDQLLANTGNEGVGQMLVQLEKEYASHGGPTLQAVLALLPDGKKISENEVRSLFNLLSISGENKPLNQDAIHKIAHGYSLFYGPDLADDAFWEPYVKEIYGSQTHLTESPSSGIEINEQEVLANLKIEYDANHPEIYADQREEVQQKLQQALLYVVKRSGTIPKHPFTVYFTNDGQGLHGLTQPDENTRKILLYTGPGVSVDQAIIIAAHEYGHQNAEDKYGPTQRLSSDLLTTEGKATYDAGKYWLGGKPDFRTYIHDTGITYPLNTYPTTYEMMNVTYMEWASFTQYLLETYGQEKFDQVYLTGLGGVQGEASSVNYSKVYGKNLSMLEKEWQQWINSTP